MATELTAVHTIGSRFHPKIRFAIAYNGQIQPHIECRVTTTGIPARAADRAVMKAIGDQLEACTCTTS